LAHSVSSVIAEIGKWRERVSRREELALRNAAELSRTTYLSSIDLIKAGKGVKVYPQTIMIRDAFRMFKHLLDRGTLDPETAEKLEEELRDDS
jgi:hypothetical protein